MNKRIIFTILTLLFLCTIVISCDKKEEIPSKENATVKEEVAKERNKKEKIEKLKEEKKEKEEEKKEDKKEVKEDSNKNNKPKVTVTEGTKEKEDLNDSERVIFVETNIMKYANEGELFAVVDAIYEEDIEYFNVTEEFDFYEDDFFENNIILPIGDNIHVKAEKVEFDEKLEDFKPVKTLWENDIALYDSNLIRVPLVEGAPSLKLTITGNDKTIIWYNTYNGKDGNGIHYYFSNEEPSRYMEFNPEALATDEISDGFTRLVQYDEVSDNIEKGMKLRFDNSYQEIGGVSCPVFVLGTDHVEHFVVEFRYAYDPDNDEVYTYNTLEDKWEVLGYG